MTPQEWQAKFDTDFPNGATCRRMDSAPPFSFRTANLTIVGENASGNPQLIFFNVDVDGYDHRLTFHDYRQTQEDPFQATITCLDGTQWSFANVIPDHVAAQWAAQRAYDREVAMSFGGF